MDLDVSSAAGDFTDDLFRRVVPADHTGNALFSPLSLLTLFSILLAGTRNKSNSQLKNALRLPSSANQTAIDNYYNTLLTSFDARANQSVIRHSFVGGAFEEEQREVLLVKNLALVSHLIDLRPDYEELARNKYHAELKKVHFTQGEQVKNQINSWVNESTNGLIPTLLQEPPSLDSSLVLMNSVFFEANWNKQFQEPYDRAFYPEGGQSKTVAFINKTQYLNYKEVPYGKKNLLLDDHLKMVELGYRNSNMSMLLFLPPESKSVNTLIAEKSLYDLANDFINNRENRRILLQMPKFKFDAKMNVKEHLSSMGAVDIFTDDADLSGISEEPLKVSKALHAASIQVDQDGTMAAAVTYLELMLLSARRPEEPFHLIIDRPFAFMIYDRHNRLPIFVGKVGDVSS